MPGFSLTEANHIMKNLYLGPIREQLNNETPLLANIKKSSKEVVGKLVVLPLRRRHAPDDPPPCAKSVGAQPADVSARRVRRAPPWCWRMRRCILCTLRHTDNRAESVGDRRALHPSLTVEALMGVSTR